MQADGTSLGRGQIDRDEIRDMGRAGVVGGLVMLATEMALYTVAGHGTWTPLRLSASALLGGRVAPPPESFHAGIVLVGAVAHFAFAIAGAGVLGLVIRRWPVHEGILGGAIGGFVLYVANAYMLAGPYPWFAAAQGLPAMLAYVTYGAVTAVVFDALRMEPTMRRPWSASRLQSSAVGVDA